jgi:hypothetical protein
MKRDTLSVLPLGVLILEKMGLILNIPLAKCSLVLGTWYIPIIPVDTMFWGYQAQPREIKPEKIAKYAFFLWLLMTTFQRKEEE